MRAQRWASSTLTPATAHELGLLTPELRSCSEFFRLGLVSRVAKGLGARWLGQTTPAQLNPKAYSLPGESALGRNTGTSPHLPLYYDK